jgi:hypothetical protein
MGKSHFYVNEGTYHFDISWSGIPTTLHSSSYYALSLPEFAIPVRLAVTDPHSPEREYRREIMRDDARHRYIVYLDCFSFIGLFEFVISGDFLIDESSFFASVYSDSQTQQNGREGDVWRHLLPQREKVKVQNFFVEELHMGDNYSTGQAGAMGPGAQASNMTFQQMWYQVQGSVDLLELARELGNLQTAMRSKAREPEDEIAIGAIAAAEAAAKQGNGAKALEYLQKAGVWALDIATKVGTEVAVAAMKSAMGIH